MVQTAILGITEVCHIQAGVSVEEGNTTCILEKDANPDEIQRAGIVFDGDVTFTTDSSGAIVDGCTVTDIAIKRALITYAQAHANWQTESKAARFRDSYDSMKRDLKQQTGYTNWGGEADG